MATSPNTKSGKGTDYRTIKLPSGKCLVATPVFDTYWRFAKMRQDVFFKRVLGESLPWTDDPVLNAHRFTNTYRASDRVSQYLIRNVLYKGSQKIEEVFFRTLLFKVFNRIDTWELLEERLGSIAWQSYSFETYAKILDKAIDSGRRIYSAAYIIPSPPFGSPRKHRNHLRLIEQMMKEGAPKRIAGASSLKEVFEILRSYPSFGNFLAFQFAIDLNYSSIIDFPESDFVVAGPGARDGIKKCFADTDGLTEEEVIFAVTEMADREFKRLGLKFQTLWGRSLQPIDCQNIFCEVDKYSRVVHPEFLGNSGRSRIKQKFTENSKPLPQWYPPKWSLKINKVGDGVKRSSRGPERSISSGL
jgi:hypothetical protein